MILLLLGLMREQLLPPNKRRMDSIDHACLWAIQICCLVLFLTLPHAIGVAANDDEEIIAKADPDFFNACSGGKLDQVRAALTEHPSEY
jgi:hypothetical protein